MLTILFLIHQWFYSTPKSRSSSISSRDINKPVNESHVGQNSHKGKESLRILKESSCKSHFYTEVALVAVCRISTSAVEVPGKELNILYPKMSMEDKFRAAVRVIHSLPKDGPYQPSNSTKLKFYGLYKQATEGQNKTAKPGFWDVIGRAKWEAWNKLGDMTKDAAMNQYVDCLKEIVETMSFNGDVEDFLDSIGPFYEFVTLQGSEMNHIKEKIEEVTSSSGSSLTNSVVPSGENSKEGSPLKILNGKQEDEEEEEVSTSEKAEISVETSTATYETKGSKNSKSFSQQNGNAFHIRNEDDEPAVPPPAPVHSYSNQNGIVKHALPNENDDDEVLTVSTPYVSTPCKEDLEHDEISNSGHRKVRITSSIETVASNATSGTESEKYYSGDSEPEFDEKFASSLATFVNNGSYQSTSAGTSQNITGTQTHSVTLSGSSSVPKKPISSSPLKKLSKDRVSPKNSSAISPTSSPDILTQQTVERLNRDVDHILARLRILEAAYAANAEGAIRTPANQMRQRRRRIFGDLSIQSIAFIVMWPFVVQFLIKLIRWWWRRRRSVIRSITHSRLS